MAVASVVKLRGYNGDTTYSAVNIDGRIWKLRIFDYQGDPKKAEQEAQEIVDAINNSTVNPTR